MKTWGDIYWIHVRKGEDRSYAAHCADMYIERKQKEAREKGMQGTRVYDKDNFQPGEYGLVGGYWHACTPNGMLGNLSGHEVVEHEDGTLTVSPSILVESHDGTSWHGYLERGVWREV